MKSGTETTVDVLRLEVDGRVIWQFHAFVPTGMQYATVLGTAQCLEDEEGDFALRLLFVHEAFRRQGMARAIMQAAIDLARQLTKGMIYLSCRRTNGPALALYRSLGFQNYEAQPQTSAEDCALCLYLIERR